MGFRNSRLHNADLITASQLPQASLQVHQSPQAPLFKACWPPAQVSSLALLEVLDQPPRVHDPADAPHGLGADLGRVSDPDSSQSASGIFAMVEAELDALLFLRDLHDRSEEPRV